MDSSDIITVDHFREYTVKDLKRYLGQRRIRADGRQGELAVLAFWAWKLKVPVNPSQQETEEQSKKRLQEILSGEKGETLPDPDGIAEREWITDVKETPPLTYADIYHYLINTPGFYTQDSLKSYRALDAYQFVTSGFVHLLHVYKIPDSPCVFIKTTVRRSQANTDPYAVWVCVNNEDLTIKGARCQCMAGLGEVCTHVAALLFKIVSATDAGLNKPATCTEVPCIWSDHYNDKTKPAEIDDIDFHHAKYGKKRKVKSRPVIPVCSSDPDDDLWDIVCGTSANCVFLQMIEPSTSKRSGGDDTIVFQEPAEDIEVVTSQIMSTSKPPTASLPKPIIEIATEQIQENPTISEDELYQKIKLSVNTEQANLLDAATKEQSNENQWHKHRQYRVTATKAHAVHRFMERKGQQPSKTTMSSIKGKSTISIANPPLAIRWGREKEDVAVKRYVEVMSQYHQNLKVEKSGLTISPGEAHKGASTDRKVHCDCCRRKVLECKCPYSARDKKPQEAIGKEISYIREDSEGVYSLDPSHQYYTQVQTQMALTETSLCDFIVYTDHGLLIIPVQFDQSFWDKVTRNIDLFYLKYIVPEIMQDVKAQLSTDRPTTNQPITMPLHSSTSSSRHRQQSQQHTSDQPSTSTPLININTTSQRINSKRRKGLYPCGTCNRPVTTNAVACDRCDIWSHFKCVGLTGEENVLCKDWFCSSCTK
ncbi:uncharacterized protein LOC144438466 [Glandiceps talaboti]